MDTAALEWGSEEHVLKTVRLITSQTDELEALRRGNELPDDNVDPYVAGTIKNPTQSRTKGCGRGSSSQKKARKNPTKKRCGKCGDVGHYRTSCHVRRTLLREDNHTDSMDVREEEEEEGTKTDDFYCGNLELVIFDIHISK